MLTPDHLLQAANINTNENDDDPRDIAAIKYAEDTLGVYVSKASESYKVPEGQEVNAEKKKRQMVLLEESMIVLKLQFNEKFLALRHLKKQLIKYMCSYGYSL